MGCFRTLCVSLSSLTVLFIVEGVSKVVLLKMCVWGSGVHPAVGR